MKKEKILLILVTIFCLLFFQNFKHDKSQTPNGLYLFGSRGIPDTLLINKGVNLLRCRSCYFDSLSRINSFKKLVVLNLEGSKGFNSLCNFDSLTKLEELYLSQTSIQYFDAKKVENSKNLKILDLSKSNLSFINSNIYLLKNLNELRLNNNKYLDSLPEELWLLDNLEVLWIANTKITYISPNIGKLKKLKVLWVSLPNIKNSKEIRSIIKRNNPDITFNP